LTTGKLVWQKDIPNWYYRSEIFGKIGRLESTESGVQPFLFNLETGARIEKEDIWSVETGYMVSKAFDHNVDLSCMKNAKVLWKLENSPGNGRILNTDQERVYWSTMSNLSSESRLSRLDIETGKMLWEKLMFPDDVNAYKDFVFVLNTISGTLDVLEASTGNLIGFINNVQSYPRIYSGYVCFVHIENDLKELHIYKIVKK
jgi:outer membrane protein assembly factor BamB